MLHQQPDLTARVRHAWRVFLLGGPVGIAYAFRGAVIDWRLRAADRCLEAEKELHQRELAALRARINHLVGEQHCLHAAQTQFRLYCEKRDLAAEVQS